MGEALRSIVLNSLLMDLGIHEKTWNIRVLPRHSVAVSGGERLTMDICVVAGSRLLQESLAEPPLLCVQVISPEDRVAAVNEKVRKCLNAGVKVVWEIHPRHQEAYEIMNTIKRLVPQLTVPGTQILVESAQVFSELQTLKWEGLAVVAASRSQT